MNRRGFIGGMFGLPFVGSGVDSRVLGGGMPGARASAQYAAVAKLFGLRVPAWVRNTFLMRSREITRVTDPNIACLRSFSASTKLRMERENYIRREMGSVLGRMRHMNEREEWEAKHGWTSF